MLSSVQKIKIAHNRIRTGDIGLRSDHSTNSAHATAEMKRLFAALSNDCKVVNSNPAYQHVGVKMKVLKMNMIDINN